MVAHSNYTDPASTSIGALLYKNTTLSFYVRRRIAVWAQRTGNEAALGALFRLVADDPCVLLGTLYDAVDTFILTTDRDEWEAVAIEYDGCTDSPCRS